MLFVLPPVRLNEDVYVLPPDPFLQDFRVRKTEEVGQDQVVQGTRAGKTRASLSKPKAYIFPPDL